MLEAHVPALRLVVLKGPLFQLRNLQLAVAPPSTPLPPSHFPTKRNVPTLSPKPMPRVEPGNVRLVTVVRSKMLAARGLADSM